MQVTISLEPHVAADPWRHRETVALLVRDALIERAGRCESCGHHASHYQSCVRANPSTVRPYDDCDGCTRGLYGPESVHTCGRW